MPVQCGTSVLTGQDGSIWFKPAGTNVCLLDSTDFPVGDRITLPISSDFRVGDPVVFQPEGAASLDTALTAGTTYYIVALDATASPATVQVSATKGGAAITLNNDGGQAGTPATTGPIATLDTGGLTPGAGYTDATYNAVALTGGTGTAATADIVVTGGVVTTVTLVAPGSGYTAGDSLSASAADLGGSGAGFSIDVATINAAAAGNSDTPGTHINMSYSDFEAVCNVSSFDLNLTRARIDTTSLKCNFSGAAAKYAPFRTYQPGFADGQGTMTVKFTRDQNALANRLLANSLLAVQDGAMARLFIDSVAGPAGIDLTESSYVEVALSIEGLSFSVGTDDSPTEASINFSFQGQPNHLFYTSLN